MDDFEYIELPRLDADNPPLFKRDETPFFAYIGWNHGDSSRYIRSFSDGAARLIGFMLDEIESGGHDDELIFPALYLYRHHLELQLKELAHYGGRAVEGNWPEPLRTHSLHVLWQSVRSLCRKRWPDGDVAELQPVDDLIAALHDVDPTSQSFRYHVDRNGKRTMDNRVQDVNLRVLVEQVQEVARILGGLDAQFDADAQWRDEMDSEFRDEW